MRSNWTEHEWMLWLTQERLAADKRSGRNDLDEVRADDRYLGALQVWESQKRARRLLVDAERQAKAMGDPV